MNEFWALRLLMGALLLASMPAFANWKVEGNRAVRFHCVGTAGIAFDGNGHDVSVVDSGSAIDVIVGMHDVQTGIALRDRHMKEKYLEEGKFPKAQLHVERSRLTVPASGKQLNSEADGQLTLHGVTQKVHFKSFCRGIGKTRTRCWYHEYQHEGIWDCRPFLSRCDG